MVVGDGSLSVVDFDPETLTVRGTPRRVVDAVRIDNNFNARYTVSRDGTLAYVEAARQVGTGRVVRMHADGRVTYGSELAVVLRPGSRRP